MIKAARVARKMFIYDGQSNSFLFCENLQFTPNRPPQFVYEMIKAARAALKMCVKMVDQIQF